MEEGAITASLWTGEVDEEKMLSVYHSEAGHTHTHTHQSGTAAGFHSAESSGTRGADKSETIH